MSHMHPRILLALGILSLLFALRLPALAQGEKPDLDAINKRKTQDLLDKARDEYRVFFKKPETGIEFWSAIKFEMDLGKFDLAAYHLKLMLEKEDKKIDADLVKIEQAEGMSAFFRLKSVRPKDWSDHEPFRKEAVANVDKLIERVTKAVETHLSDPVRIQKFIKNLDAPTEEERGFAYVQLARSRERAIPYLIEAIRTNYGKTIFPKLRETLIRIGPETVPVYLEAFKAVNDKDYRDVEMRLTLLDIIQKRDDKRVIPYLWHMYGSKRYPDAVRKKAKETLASLLRIDIDNVPPAKESLTALAERYYQHKIPFNDKDVPMYFWDGEKIIMPPFMLPPFQVEEVLGIRYAKEALDIDPSWQPAQVVFLSLMLERENLRRGMDRILLEPMPPKMHELLTTIDADLAMRVLDRAMDDHQVAVALPLIQALGDRGEIRAARLQAGGQPRGVVKALYYPDRRVQFAAVKAMLKMPVTTIPAVASDRVVEVSRRFLASDLKPKALVVHAPVGQEQAARDVVTKLGFEPVLVGKTADAMNKAQASADFDLVILHRGLADADLPIAYGQLRKNVDLGGLPMLIVVDKAREKSVKKFAGRDSGVLVVTDDRFKADDAMKDALDKLSRGAFVVKLSEAERKQYAKSSLDILWRMARGEIKGYNLSPAVETLIDRLNSKDYAVEAAEILGRLPGKQIQYKLAGIVADPARDKLRLPACTELNRHIQDNGVLIDPKLIGVLKTAQTQAAEGTPLRAQLNITASLIGRTTAAKTGDDLGRFRPDPPPAPKDQKKEKEN
jgi:tetratricopeptide (TPR) repeat protein